MQIQTTPPTKSRVLLRLADLTPPTQSGRAGHSAVNAASSQRELAAPKSWFSNPLLLVACLGIALASIAFFARDRGTEVEAKNPQPEVPIQGLKMVVPAEEPVAMPTPPVQPIEPLPRNAQAAPVVPVTPSGPRIERLPQTQQAGQATPPASFSDGPALTDTSDLFDDNLLRPGVARLENRIGKPTESASNDQSRPGLY